MNRNKKQKQNTNRRKNEFSYETNNAPNQQTNKKDNLGNEGKQIFHTYFLDTVKQKQTNKQKHMKKMNAKIN
jgi:hypothetical protein